MNLLNFDGINGITKLTEFFMKAKATELILRHTQDDRIS
jgi:hypothetical protein